MRGEGSRAKSLAFHAERLHDPPVWRRVERVARWMSRHEMNATFFVYPFRAQVAGRDIADQVRALAAMGHEIGQHTHFYAGTRIEKPDKVTDLSPANIAHCIRRDFTTLQEMSMTPRGFTAGAWIVNEQVWDTLIELGFSYDCSVRVPKPTQMADVPDYRYERSPGVYCSDNGRLVLVPTTCSLGEWFRWGRRPDTDRSVPHQLVYLHDYDLLMARYCWLLWVFLGLHRGANMGRAGDLAQIVTGGDAR